MICCPALKAQSESAEKSWQELLNREVPGIAKRPVRTGGRTPAEQAQERSELVAHYAALAQQAQHFTLAYPDHAKANIAKVIEAKSLLKLAFLGDSSRSARADLLVTQIENDTSLPDRLRFEVIALSEHILLRQTAKNPSEARAAHETSARHLIKEFPHEVGGYLTLLSSVDASGDTVRVLAVAQEIEESPAPFAAKGAARVVATRYALIGKSLADVANTALGRQNFFEAARNRRVLLYTWATWSPGSVEFAKNVLGKIKDDVLVIGYNLDRDVEAAKAMARKEKLPGAHYYDSAGPGSWLTLLLSLNTAPLVYLTDQNGVITDVSAQRKNVLAVVNPGRAN